MCETIEFDGLVGVHVSRHIQAASIGDDHLHLLHYRLHVNKPLLGAISQSNVHHGSMGNIFAVIRHHTNFNRRFQQFRIFHWSTVDRCRRVGTSVGLQ